MREHYDIPVTEPGRVNLVQITDTHIMSDPGERFDGVDTAATLSAVLNRIERLDPLPDALLVTGDLVHEPEPAAYKRLLELLAPMRPPVFCLPGNHDDPGLMNRYLNYGSVHTTKSLSAGNWCLLLLDSRVQNSHAGRLSQEELCFMETGLATMEPDYSLIALHHPPVSLGSPWMDAMGLENATEFLLRVDNHACVRAVMWGHAHQEYDSWRDRIRLLGSPSTCVQFKPGADRYIKDDRLPAFRQLFLRQDGIVTTRVERVPA